MKLPVSTSGCTIKEPRFWNLLVGMREKSANTDALQCEYEQLFRHGRNCSTCTLFDTTPDNHVVGIPQEVHSRVAAARWIAIMREPATRVWSLLTYRLLHPRFTQRQLLHVWREANMVPKLHPGDDMSYLQNVSACLRMRCPRIRALAANAFDAGVNRTLSQWHTVQSRGGKIEDFVHYSDGGQLDHDIRSGVYVVPVTDVIRIFGRKSVHAIRMDRLKSHPEESLAAVFEFAGLGWRQGDSALRATAKHTKHVIETPGMVALRQWYEPFNMLLARTLGDNSFLFGD